MRKNEDKKERCGKKNRFLVLKLEKGKMLLVKNCYLILEKISVPKQESMRKLSW